MLRALFNFTRRKRFKRYFEKDDEPIQLKGSVLGVSSEGATPVAKTPRTSKSKVATVSKGDDTNGSPKAKGVAKKRKAADVNEGESTDYTEANDDSKDNTPEAAEDDATGSPKKKARTTKPATPKAPKSPKIPATPKMPRAPRTPKSTKAAKAIVKEESDAEATEHTKQSGRRVGSPEIQAKTDGEIKDIEKKTGTMVGEPEKQAIHDGVQRSVASASASSAEEEEEE